MKVLRILFLLLLAATLGVLGLAMTKPDTFRIERSATIAAAPDAVFEQVNDFHKWDAWSPWEHMDPAMKKTFTGAESGTGAEYAWAGNDKVGEGRMTILASEPASKIDIKLEFLKPFAATSQTVFAFAPEGEGTKVTWTMSGPMNFMSKVMCVFQDMDKMVGPDFEKGLAKLKTVAEAAPAAAAADTSAAAPGGKAAGK